MTQIMDAPYIVEAETKGVPPYGEDDFPVSDIADDFAQAKSLIGQAVRYLCRAANTAEKYGKEKAIDELIQTLDDDIPYQMDQIINGFRKEV